MTETFVPNKPRVLGYFLEQKQHNDLLLEETVFGERWTLYVTDKSHN